MNTASLQGALSVPDDAASQWKPWRAVLFAPQVHTGGGLVLLADLCRNWPADVSCTAHLDVRAKLVLPVPDHWEVYWVRRSFRARLAAERLMASKSEGARLVLCFHNLPPIFPCKAPVLCYLQNPNLVGLSDPGAFSGWVRLRLGIERGILRVFRNNVDTYVVQTPTMMAAFRKWRRGRKAKFNPNVVQVPFAPADILRLQSEVRATSKKWDFLYVADGQAHKNHATLFEAWVLLRREGLRPSLAVTLNPERDQAHRELLANLVSEHDLDIVDLGSMPHLQVLSCYRSAGAMIFPSLAESFGMPFLEARSAGLPILAGELDFVRDMCEPTQTFDPTSARSIARAVKRFLGHPEPPVQPLSSSGFVDWLLSIGGR